MKTLTLRYFSAFLAATLSLTLVGTPQAAAQTTITWTGAVDADYHTAGNWDIGVVPINDTENTYAVVIPGGATVNLSADGTFEVTDLSLAGGGTLNVGSGSTLTVLDEAAVAGLITASNGQFVAATPGAAQFSGTTAQIAVANLGSVEIAAQSYSSTGLYRLNWNGSVYDTHLFEATGSGSTLDLSSVQSIDAGINDGTGNHTSHRIIAELGGHIDLSGLTTVRAPYQEWDDKLTFEIGAGSSIDLSGLTTTTSAGSGRTEFVLAENGTALSLPSLTAADRVVFAFSTNSSVSMPEVTALTNVNFSGSQWTLVAPKLTEFSGAYGNVTVSPGEQFQTGRDVGGLTDVDNARFKVTDGATWGVTTGDFAASTYSSTGLSQWNWNGSFYDARLFEATGSGSVLDLASLQSIDAGVHDSTGNDTRHRIIAELGGHVDLSGLTTVRAPSQEWDDRLTFEIGTGSSIDLSGLTSTTSAGSGRTEFVLDEGVALSLPSLTSADRIAFSLSSGSSASLPELTTLTNAAPYGTEWTLIAPELTEFSGPYSSVTILPTTQFQTGRDVGGLTQVDNARFRATDGATWGVTTGDFAATSYSSTAQNLWPWNGTLGRYEVTLFEATQSATLDLSTLESIDGGINDQSGGDSAQRIIASSGGHLDLSGVTTVRGPYQEWNDKLTFEIGAGSSIDLSNLTTIISSGSGRTEFVLGEGVALSLPSLTTADRAAFNFSASSSAALPELTKLTNASPFGDQWTLVAPKLNEFSGPYSSVTISPTEQFQTGRDVGGLTNIDNARFKVAGGATWGVSTGDFAATSYSSTSQSQWPWNGSLNRYEVTLFEAAESATLDLSTLETIDGGINDQSGSDTTQRIIGSDGGHIDLSGVTSVRGPYQEWNDKLTFEFGTGGSIDLSSLATVTSSGNGRTEFVLDENTALNLPSLTAADRTVFAFSAGASASLPELTTLTNAVPSGSNWAFVAPKLTEFSGPYSSATILPTTQFQTGRDVGGLTDIDNARLAVADGTTWGVSTGDVAATSYSSTSQSLWSWNEVTARYEVTLFEATGGAVLDLSSLQSIDGGINDQSGSDTAQKIVASSGGQIDLSGVTTVRGPYQEWNDVLEFAVSDTGSTIDLSSLRVINTAGYGRVEFQINTGGQLLLGDLVQTTNAVFRINDMSSTLAVDGNLNLSETSELHVETLAEVAVSHSFVFAQTDEAKVDLDQAVLRMNGTGLQFLEVGGEDLGLPSESGGSGNFGIGQLVIGDVGEPTTVELLDAFDNGNRGDGQEALYLYGIGINEDGLIMSEGSALIVDYLDAYAWIDGGWIHLNDWLQDGMAPSTKALGGAWMEFDPKAQSVKNVGKVPEPGIALTCVWLLLGILRLRYRGRSVCRPE